MKKILLSLSIASFLFFPVIALGEIPTGVIVAPSPSVWTVISKIVNLLWTFLLVAAGISIFIAAYLFLTAGGDPAKVNTARSFIMYAIIALVVGAAAIGIVTLLRTQLQ